MTGGERIKGMRRGIESESRGKMREEAEKNGI